MVSNGSLLLFDRTLHRDSFELINEEMTRERPSERVVLLYIITKMFFFILTFGKIDFM